MQLERPGSSLVALDEYLVCGLDGGVLAVLGEDVLAGLQVRAGAPIELACKARLSQEVPMASLLAPK